MIHSPTTDAKAVFEILVRENAPMLTTYLRSVVWNPSAVDDLFQETMLTAWQKLSVYDTGRPFGPWLRGIAARLVLAHSRKQQKDMLTCTESVLTFLDHQIHHIDQRPGDTWDDKIATLRQCIDALPQRHRLAIEQRYLQSDSAKNTAAHLDISLEALKKRLQRARTQLFDCLTRKGMLAEITP